MQTPTIPESEAERLNTLRESGAPFRSAAGNVLGALCIIEDRPSTAAVPSGTGPTILVDCISRVLFLQQGFRQELDAVRQSLGQRPLLGMLTLGKIANGGNFCLEFDNKTFALAVTVD